MNIEQLNVDPKSITKSIESGNLPEPDMISYYVLEKDRCIFVDFDIDENLMCIVRLLIRWNLEDVGIPREQRKPIRMFIHSYGGVLDYAWNIIDVMQTSQTPIYTVNLGTACSSAALIFLAGEKRFMMPRANVLIHQGSAAVAGDAIKVLDASDAYKKQLARMKEYILERTAIPKAVMTKKINNDWELLADECLEYNICTAVINNIDEVLPQGDA